MISGRDLPDSLADLRRLRLDFAFRERVRVVRPARINPPLRVQHHNGQSSCAKSSEFTQVYATHAGRGVKPDQYSIRIETKEVEGSGSA